MVVKHEAENFHHEDDEDASEPDHEEDLSESVEEHVEDGEGPATHGEHPAEGHKEPSDDADVESHPTGSSKHSPESHLVPRRMLVIHVLSLVYVKVVDHIEGGQGTVDGPPKETRIGRAHV